MEKVDRILAIPLTSGWSDLGSWNSVWEETAKSIEGVVTSPNTHAIDCRNSLLHSGCNIQLVGVGLDNIVAVCTPDAVLVASKSEGQSIGKVVNELRSKNISQADSFNKDHRPWGWFETLTLSNNFQVKRIYVNPKAALSLQSHKHRSEHWIVVEGTAKVTVDGKVELISEGQSVYVPVGSIHRLENPGKEPMILIEVQTGTYLGEDDIVRYEDLYARKT